MDRRAVPRPSGLVTPTGLRLTVLLVIALGAVWTLLGLTQDVLAHEEMSLFDHRAHNWVVAHRVAWLNPLMQAATWLGASAVLIPVLLVAALVAWRARRSWRPVLDTAVVYARAVLLYTLIKQLVHRPRPPASAWLVHASGFAFPSGHTTQAPTAWGIVCVLACAGRSARIKTVLASAAAVIVLLVAASRVY